MAGGREETERKRLRFQATGCAALLPSVSKAHPIIASCAPSRGLAGLEDSRAALDVTETRAPRRTGAGGGFSGAGCFGPRRVVASAVTRLVGFVGRDWRIILDHYGDLVSGKKMRNRDAGKTHPWIFSFICRITWYKPSGSTISKSLQASANRESASRFSWSAVVPRTS